MDQRQTQIGFKPAYSGYQSERALPRPRLIERLQSAFLQQSTVLIEARAGQGKSWLAAQYLAQSGGRYCWYAADQTLGNPLAALWAALAEAFPGMPSLASQSQSSGAFPVALDERIDKLLNALFASLARAGQGRACLVIDAAEALTAQAPGRRLLERLIAVASPSLRVIITARPGCLASLEPTMIHERVARIDPDSLLFSSDELSTFYARAYGICPTPGCAERFYRESGGWPRGLDFLAALLSHGNEPDRSWIDAALCDYFDAALLADLPVAARQRLCQLALIDAGDEALALALIYPAAEPSAQSEGGGFVDAEGGLHPQLRIALSRLVNRELALADRRALLARAAEHQQQCADWAGAACYALAAGQPAVAEQALAQAGGELLDSAADGRLGSALTRAGSGALADFPYALLHRASLSRAELHGAHDPGLATDALERAAQLFAERGDAPGELLALSELLQQLVLLEGRHGAAMPRYQRALLLQREAQDQLGSAAASRVGAILGVASLLLHGDRRQALQQLDAAVEAIDAAELTAPTRQRIGIEVRGLRVEALLMGGQLAAASDDLEALQQPLLASGRGRLAQAHVRLMQLQWLWLAGECSAFDRHCDHLEGELAGLLPEASTFWPRFQQQRIERALSLGEWATAEQLLRLTLRLPQLAEHRLLRGHLLAQRALLHAQQGRDAAARCDASEAAALRWSAGGHCQILYSHLALGAVYVQLGDWPEAETRLNEAVRGAEQLELIPLCAGALLQRAQMWLLRGHHPEALADAERWLALMAEHRLQRCPSWLSEVAGNVLEFAQGHELRPVPTRRLATSLGVGFDSRGHRVPLLQVRSLGVFDFSIEGETRLTQADFTPAQRNLLAMLLASPEQSLGQSVIQLALWPDSSADKARSTLDTLLSRLRSLFNQRLAPWKAGPYLVLKRGVLSLENVLLDAAAFQADGHLGEKHRNRRPWEAEWRLQRALSLWQGRFCLGVDALYSVADLRERLFDQYGQYTCHYALLAEQSGRIREAAALLSAHFQCNAADPELTDRLCALYARLRRPDRIAQILHQHRAAVAAAERELRGLHQSMQPA